ncbi:MAG TPA: ABC transporter ATP-binding protein [Syntrophorhabdus sp.]|nr:ABC transporter ATP-binding protein [Syntrophorhabdus sp.]MDI9557567.1 ABC transporter ATP-binding protein [Pseudomonadota bacterium]OQB78431.1 MAG: Macrolide export ATP-binding/permease protein MacB [Deltaproteobacteria bacterium ADurb.Bin135]MBP8745513.1 ABC transporter ATP-binding protein [Syntrophorhabdus sp.]NMC94447.1 ABC transporter ATP-binding protein [Syntrophorhabdus sp.]
MITLRNIKKSYFIGERELPILKGIDLEIRSGEFVVLMGVSGSGKTTLMNIVGLLDKQTEGEYRFMDVFINGLDDERLASMRNLHIGFVFQQFFLLPYLNAIENVLIPIVYSSKDIKHPREKSKALLSRFGLAERVYNKPSQLSGGEQQRVAIARALINEPDLILADEPTGALDSKTGGEIMDLFRILNDEGKTVIVVTHDPKLASFGKRLIRIEDGTISEDITR